MKVVPTKLTKFNVYDGFTRLVGIGDEVTLPDFEPLSDTVSGAAFLGEFDDLLSFDKFLSASAQAFFRELSCLAPILSMSS